MPVLHGIPTISMFDPSGNLVSADPRQATLLLKRGYTSDKPRAEPAQVAPDPVLTISQAPAPTPAIETPVITPPPMNL